MRRSLFLSLIVALLVLALAAPAHAGERMRPVGDAVITPDGEGAILTAAAAGQIGGAYLLSRRNVGVDWVATFKFRIADPSPAGGDGLAFLIQNDSSDALGDGGAGLGYAGISNSLAVEFDTYQNSDTAADPNDNHVSVHSLGTSPNSFHESASLGSATPATNMSDGAIHEVRVDYTSGTLNVRLDGVLLVAVPVDLVTFLGLTDGAAWVGLTAATGAEFQRHEVSFTRWQVVAVVT